MNLAENLGLTTPQQSPRPTVEDRERRKHWTAAFLLVSPFVYAGLSQFLRQDIDWDLQNYHFFDTYWVLVDHMRDVTPAQLQTYLSPILDTPFYFATDHISPRLTGYLLAVIQGVSFPLLYLINRHFTANRLVALGLAGLGMLTAGALSELGTIMGDTLVAPFFFAAILIGLHSLDASRSHESKKGIAVGLIVTACALVGVGAGLKLSELPIALGIAAAFPLVSGTFSQRVRKCLYAGGSLALGVLVSYGWWGYELATQYGNPILPYMNQIFHSAYAPLAPNTDMTYIDRTWKTHGIVYVIFDPIMWTLHPTLAGSPPLVEASVPILELLLIALVVISVVRAVAQHRTLKVFDNAKQRFLIVVVVISYFIFVLQFAYYRYFIPIEMLSFTAIFVCLQALSSRVEWKPAVRVGIVGIGIAGIALFCLYTEKLPTPARSQWSSSYFSASIPRSLTDNSAAFLMLGGNPNAYVVTFFPQKDYFARVQGNLPPTPYVNRIIAREIAAYQRTYVIWNDPIQPQTVAAFMAGAQASTAQVGLQVDWNRCVQFPASVGAAPENFHVCRTVAVPPITLNFTGSISYLNAGSLTSGGFIATSTNSTITSVDGSGTVPGLKGGSATITVKIHRSWLYLFGHHQFYVGTISVHDPGEDLFTSAFVLTKELTPVSSTEISGVAHSLALSPNRASYTLDWTLPVKEVTAPSRSHSADRTK